MIIKFNNVLAEVFAKLRTAQQLLWTQRFDDYEAFENSTLIPIAMAEAELVLFIGDKKIEQKAEEYRLLILNLCRDIHTAKVELVEVHPPHEHPAYKTFSLKLSQTIKQWRDCTDDTRELFRSHLEGIRSTVNRP